jgi:hypothetical protein
MHGLVSLIGEAGRERMNAPLSLSASAVEEL